MMTSEEYKLNFQIPKRMKYRNKPVIIDNIRFQSIKEGNQYLKYKMLQKIGELTFERQVKFDIAVNGVRICAYICDFVLTWKSGNVQVVDVKSEATKKIASYVIKKKLMKAVHDIVIFEV